MEQICRYTDRVHPDKKRVPVYGSLENVTVQNLNDTNWDPDQVQMDPEKQTTTFPVELAIPKQGFLNGKGADLTIRNEAKGWLAMSLHALEQRVQQSGGTVDKVKLFTDAATPHGVVVRKVIYAGYLLVQAYLEEL